MTLFNLFGHRPKENAEMTPAMEENPQVEGMEDTTPTDDAKTDNEKRLITITWGTGMPIDIVFNFIHKNFEEDGFQDALVNQDITYRDAKENI